MFHQPPHDQPWERAMTAYDPDGYAVEFAQGKRGQNQTNRRGSEDGPRALALDPFVRSAYFVGAIGVEPTTPTVSR